MDIPLTSSNFHKSINPHFVKFSNVSALSHVESVLWVDRAKAKGQRDPEAVEDIKKRNGCRWETQPMGTRDVSWFLVLVFSI
jgi:hypothetical protein